jgi:hypothetical protein
MLRLAEQREVLGLILVDLTHGQHASHLFPTLEAALEMIADVDSKRLARIRHDVRRVAVMQSFASAGEFWPHYSAIALEVKHVEAHTLLSICMTIVHEATHARIVRWGVRDSIDRGRLERACVEQEIMFARKVPGSERLIEGALRKLDTRWWIEQDNAHRFQRRLERAGTPKWLQRLLLWLYY